MTVRYGARAVQVNREMEAKKADIWSEAVTAVYETRSEERRVGKECVP